MKLYKKYICLCRTTEGCITQGFPLCLCVCVYFNLTMYILVDTVLWMLHCVHCICCKFDTASLAFTSVQFNWPVKHLLCPPTPTHPPPFPTGHTLRAFLIEHKLHDLFGLPQKLCDTALKSATSVCSEDIRLLFASLCMWGCVGVFRSPVAGSLPVTVLWTSSSWGVSTAQPKIDG